MNRLTPSFFSRRIGLPIMFAFMASLFIAPTSCPCAAPLAADLVHDGQPIDLLQKKYTRLFQELQQQHQFSPEALRQIFQGLRIKRQVLVLMDKQWEARPYHQYAPLFLTADTIREGRQKLAQHAKLLDRIEEQFGVDREIVVAIWGVETRYGAKQGDYGVLQSLNTLFDAYPRRSDFFRKELIHFLLLCRENNIDPRVVMGSFAGAFGQTQFIPSSFREYAVSFDGDEQRDVWRSTPDILASIANYLQRSGWTLHAPIYTEIGQSLSHPALEETERAGLKGRIALDAVRQAQRLDLPDAPGNKKVSIIGLELPPEASENPKRYVAGYPNLQAITQWNRSNRYAMAVAELAEAFGRSSSE